MSIKLKPELLDGGGRMLLNLLPVVCIGGEWLKLILVPLGITYAQYFMVFIKKFGHVFITLLQLYRVLSSVQC